MDGCLNFRWLGAYENAGGFQLESGINTPAAVKGSDGVTRRPAIIISSSPHKKGTAETPWQDFFDVDNGHIRYFGDNKDPGKDPAQAPGNKALLTAFRLSHSHEKADRALTPPLLFFRRVTHQGRSKGFPAFQGFGVVRSVELITQWDNRNQRSFTNYAFDFTVFNLESESEKFDWTWINARRNPGLSLAETHSFAPKSWKSWIANGSNYLERARRRVSRLRVEKRDEQRPAPHSEASSVLAEIYEHYNDKKHKFEALAEDISCRVVGAEGGHYKKGWITPPGSDGGSDFIASIKLGSDFSSAQIVVLGQAKCVRLDSPTHGNHIARTVARLKRGWIGVFVTTSYFSESVQQEVIEDRYPIVLIHGRRLAEEVAKVVHDNEQFRTVTDYLDTLDSQYELRIQQRQPEEVLY
tara:strand:- start:210 stop:1442 length:1233 start_codon:yes stop_codon:yes gene_type:complete